MSYNHREKEDTNTQEYDHLQQLNTEPQEMYKSLRRQDKNLPYLPWNH